MIYNTLRTFDKNVYLYFYNSKFKDLRLRL